MCDGGDDNVDVDDADTRNSKSPVVSNSVPTNIVPGCISIHWMVVVSVLSVGEEARRIKERVYK